MPYDNATNAPDPAPTPGYRALLGNREFAGLYAGFTLTVAASTLSGFALGTLVDRSTGSPFLTAVSMYGATFATVLGATTLMSVADGDRPAAPSSRSSSSRWRAPAHRRSPGCCWPPASACSCCSASSSP
nr:hypothetical protein [Streptomyces tendae]